VRFWVILYVSVCLAIQYFHMEHFKNTQMFVYNTKCIIVIHILWQYIITPVFHKLKKSAFFQINDLSILASINKNNTYYRPFFMLKFVTDFQVGQQ
jgi:hypothetical protein